MFIRQRERRERGAVIPLTVYTAGLSHRQEAVDRPTGDARYHLLYVESGEGYIEDGEGRHRLSKGTAVYIPRSYPVKYYGAGEKMYTAWITFGGGIADLLADYYGGTALAICPDSGIHSKIAEIARILERGVAQDKISALTYELIVNFFTDLEYKSTPSEILTAKRYIEESYMRDISVGEIARAVGVSESLLYRLFREEEGITPVGYIRGVRMERAERMLIGSPDVRVSDIAAACGFPSASYFCKIFRESHGISPRSYRTNAGL